MPTATMRPDSTISGVSNLVGAATSHDAMSDNSDASYDRPESRVTLGFQEFALPATARVKQARVRVRASTIGGAAGTTDVQLLVNGGLLSTAALVADVGVSFAEISGPYVAVSWAQADIDAISASFDIAEGSLDLVRFAEAYIDVVYAIQPLVAVTELPATSEASSSLPITWTYSPGADGGSQAWWEVRVYTAAQALTSGYNPLVTTPFSTSGIQAGTVLAYSTEGLPDGSYWVYLRVAQLVNGVAHWSDQVFTGTILTALRPEVAVTAPTGTTTATSTLDTAWTYTPGAGGAQTRYQVRIFSAAEYGVAGFNLAASPASYDSGEVIGSATTHRSASMANGTYRAYVRAAQLVNGVAHWSEWDYSEAVLDATGPTVASVTATADPARARNRITVTRDTAGVAWSTFDLERTDDQGQTWVAVRGATAATPPGDVWIGYDYEAANGAVVQYRARGTTATGIAGAWVSSTTVSWASTVAWIKHPSAAERNMTFRTRSWPEPVRGRRAGVHRPVGRADPVVVTDVRQLITGTFVIYTATETEADALVALLEAAVVLVQSPPAYRFGSRWIAPLDVTEIRGTRRAGEQIRWWQIPFVEVAAPADDGIIVSGMTWADVLATYADWQALVDTGLTWGDLVGPAPAVDTGGVDGGGVWTGGAIEDGGAP